MIGTQAQLTTVAGQLTLNDTGLADANGVVWYLTGLEGWDVHSPVHPITERPQGDGAWIDQGRYPARVVTLRGAFRCVDPDKTARRAALVRALRDLNRATRTATEFGRLVVTEWDGTVLESAYAMNGDPQAPRVGDQQVLPWQLVLVCPDPLRYDAARGWRELALTLSVSTADTEGKIYPARYPVRYFAAGQTADRPVTAVVAGDAPTPPIIEFRGPVTNPELELTATGDLIAAFITVGPGDVLTIDLTGPEPSVMLNGSSPRLGAITTDSSLEWRLQPGPNPLRFTAASWDEAVPSVIRWRDAHY